MSVTVSTPTAPVLVGLYLPRECVTIFRVHLLHRVGLKYLDKLQVYFVSVNTKTKVNF